MSSRVFLEGIEIRGRFFIFRDICRQIEGICNDFLEQVLLSDEIESIEMETQNYMWELYDGLVNINERMKEELFEPEFLAFTQTVKLFIIAERCKAVKSVIEDMERCLNFKVSNVLKEDLDFYSGCIV